MTTTPSSRNSSIHFSFRECVLSSLQSSLFAHTHTHTIRMCYLSRQMSLPRWLRERWTIFANIFFRFFFFLIFVRLPKHLPWISTDAFPLFAVHAHDRHQQIFGRLCVKQIWLIFPSASRDGARRTARLSHMICVCNYTYLTDLCAIGRYRSLCCGAFHLNHLDIAHCIQSSRFPFGMERNWNW